MRIAPNNLIVIAIVICAYVYVDFHIAWFFPLNSFQISAVIVYYGLVIFQLCFILLAVSPAGERVLRFAYGAKPLTNREKDKVLPLFEEVYYTVKNRYRHTNPHIQLFVEDTMKINAYSFGCKTVVVTRGAIELLSPEQIKGLLAHEFGHIVRGDTMLPLVLLVGNGMVLLFILAVKAIQAILLFIASHGDVLFLGRILNWIINSICTIVLFFVQVLLLVNRRHNEYLADKFTVYLGYKKCLVDALYRLYDIRQDSKRSIIDTIKADHPDMRSRIINLEETSKDDAYRHPRIRRARNRLSKTN